jgi:hypothetical protein
MLEKFAEKKSTSGNMFSIENFIRYIWYMRSKQENKIEINSCRKFYNVEVQ